MIYSTIAYTLLCLFIVIPGFGVWSLIIISSSFTSSPNSIFKFNSSSLSFNIFLASLTFSPIMLGVETCSTFSISS